jgi:hypothetical protein
MLCAACVVCAGEELERDLRAAGISAGISGRRRERGGGDVGGAVGKGGGTMKLCGGRPRYQLNLSFF